MVNHIDKIDILKYAADILPTESKEKVEAHLLSCNICSLKVAHGFAKMNQACEKVQALFADYNQDKLERVKNDLVRHHLVICDNCNNKYEKYLKKAEHKSIEVFLENLKTFSLDNIEKFKKKSTDIIKQGKKSFLDELMGHEFNKGGIHIGLKDTREGNLLVYLKSDKYNVSGVNVSLRAKTKEGFNPIMSAVTTKEGIARLGKKEKIETDKKSSSYSLYVYGLKKKIK